MLTILRDNREERSPKIHLLHTEWLIIVNSLARNWLVIYLKYQAIYHTINNCAKVLHKDEI